MARVLKGSYLHIPRSSANVMNHTCFCLPSRSWYSFTDPGGWKAELALDGWLVTYCDDDENDEDMVKRIKSALKTDHKKDVIGSDRLHLNLQANPFIKENLIT